MLLQAKEIDHCPPSIHCPFGRSELKTSDIITFSLETVYFQSSQLSLLSCPFVIYSRIRVSKGFLLTFSSLQNLRREDILDF